uniref:JmjC domain-containing protein n=1 Tax=Lotharella oceanica TaxID=641309 RepID=A0A7S2TKF3_9EUKA|mmetsp:Transcript_18389/g.34717  ORF Transcript_18389/g.34717 Transcript_18389/m.34717 type:complete len:516 (+) Transcript_18389:39-1586(+)
MDRIERIPSDAFLTRVGRLLPLVIKLPSGSSVAFIGENPTICAHIDGDIRTEWHVDYDVRLGAGLYQKFGLKPFGLDPFLWIHVIALLPFEDHGSISEINKFFFKLIGDDLLWRTWALHITHDIEFQRSWRYSLCGCDNRQPVTNHARISSFDITDTKSSTIATSQSPSQQPTVPRRPFPPPPAPRLSRPVATAAAVPEGAGKRRKVTVSSKPDCPKIAVFSNGSLSYARFMRESVRSSKPIQFRHTFVSDVFNPDAWSLPGLSSSFGTRAFTVISHSLQQRRHTMTLKNYLDYARGHQDFSDPLYLFDGNVPNELQQGVTSPDVLKDADLSENLGVSHGNEPPQAKTCREWLQIGCKDTGTGFHVDPFSFSAWSALAHGRKCWAFYPPQVIPPGVKAFRISEKLDGQEKWEYEAPTSASWFQNILRNLKPEERPLLAIQEPGDIIFVPARWWHCVINETFSVGYTRNIVTRNNARIVAKQIATSDPWLCRALREEMLDSHADDARTHDTSRMLQ